MTLYRKLRNAFTNLVNSENSHKVYEANQQINEAHMAAKMKIGQFRNDGF